MTLKMGEEKKKKKTTVCCTVLPISDGLNTAPPTAHPTPMSC